MTRRDCLAPPPEGTPDRAAYDQFRAFLAAAGPAPRLTTHEPHPDATDLVSVGHHFGHAALHRKACERDAAAMLAEQAERDGLVLLGQPHYEWGQHGTDHLHAEQDARRA